MDELRFDGQVAVVTGAGGNPGLGRSHALLLASRGARVVVNDLGTGPDGRGSLPVYAERVVEEIVAAGGEAVADGNSVATPETAAAVVQTALDTWGRIDILVNNAGLQIPALFAELSAYDMQRLVDVHLMGTIWMSRAAWPHMQAAGYGRIVNTASPTLFGFRHFAIYGAAKGGVFALTRNLAIEGADDGILVNAIAPSAQTAGGTFAIEGGLEDHFRSATLPEQVSPAVALLAHDSCSITGKFFRVVGGRVAEILSSETRGYLNPALTIEELRDNWDEVVDRTDATEIPDPIERSAQRTLQFKPYQPTG